MRRALAAVKGPVAGAGSAILAQLVFGSNGPATAAHLDPTNIIIGGAIMGWTMLVDVGSRIAKLEELFHARPWEKRRHDDSDARARRSRPDAEEVRELRGPPCDDRPPLF